MASALWPLLRQSVTPIAVIQDQRTIPWGTGTFFRVVDDSFLVTAYHVFDSAMKRGVDHNLHVFDLDGNVEGNVGLRPVPLNGTLHRAKDPPDVAVLALDEKTASAIDSRHFLRMNQVRLRPRRPGRCWVYGYPQETAEDIPARSLFLYKQFFTLAPLCERSLALDGYDPNLHFLMDVARDDLWEPDGTPAEMPYRLNGISGCSIWQSDWPKDKSPENWDPNSFRIVGVQTSYYRTSSVIKVTPWEAVANVLYQVRPDLRAVIEMHLGPAW
jgi:hypothetical protein